MGNYVRLHEFRFWCQKVLPLVYDDSLSYYEVLCKLVEYLNTMIDNMDGFDARIEELKKELAVVQKWIDDYDTSFAEEIIRQHLCRMIYPFVTDDGHIAYVIPDEWKDIGFATTGLDCFPEGLDYGHLVIKVWDEFVYCGDDKPPSGGCYQGCN